MILSSLKRLRIHCAGYSAEPLSNSLKNNRLLTQWLSSTSAQVEGYLNRLIELKSYTEYFDITFNRDEYWVKAFPINSITSVYSDSSGLWDNSSSSESDYFIGAQNQSVILSRSFSYEARKALKIIYIGGLAAHAVNSTFTITDITGTFVVNKLVIGATSGAVGYIVSWDGSDSLVVESYYGIFIDGEILNMYDDESTISSPVANGTLTLTSESLAQKYPDIVSAVETQIRFYWKHTSDFENEGTVKDGATLRRPVNRNRNYPLQTEVLDLLNPYRKLF